ncbi:unnamed protein product [Linum tenue]|uniref:Auxin efflux carrier component n=1 Tax=Linum tenue TaxID=586396 RepID=A0AAV0KF41_9ROSI|nr:unnamed protein product [Linum tenue]
MITGKEFYQVLSALVPLYLTMGLAYASVRWWKIFTPEQCAGINRFVAVFAVPLLSFTFVASNNLYRMNYRFLAADTIQKASLLILLLLLSKTPLLRRRRRHTTASSSSSSSLDWVITLFSLSTLPNTLVVGIPLLAAMYGDFTSPLMVQIVVLQSIVWYTILLALFEYRAAVRFIADQFPAPGTAARISSVRVDPDVVSLSSSGGRTVVGASIADVDERGNIHVVVSRLSASSTASFSVSSTKSLKQQQQAAAAGAMTVVNNNNNNASSYREAAGAGTCPPRASDLTGVEIWSVRSSPRNSNFVEEDGNVEIKNMVSGRKSLQQHHYKSGGGGGGSMSRPPQLLHMFSWSGTNNTSSFPGYYYSRNNLNDNYNNSNIGMKKNKVGSSDGEVETRTAGVQGETNGWDHIHITGERKVDVVEEEEEEKGMAPKGVMTKLVLIMVWKKLVRNPNSYASLSGVVWSLLAFRWNLTLPAIVKNSVSILANTGLGMAMFSLGLFMALQPKVIACGKWMALLAMVARFLLGPGLAAAAALAVGVRGVLLQVTIVQAALPQGIVPFVFAKEYDLHPDILSTA